MSVLRAVAGVLLASAVGGLALGAVYGAKDGLLMGLFMAGCGIPVVTAAHLLVPRAAPVGSLARRFAVAVLVTVGLVTVGVLVVAQLMLISHHDALVITILLLLAGGLTAYSTWLLSRDVIAQREAAEGARRQLVAAVSHDLRTPLTSLRLIADALSDELVDEEARSRYLGQMSLHVDTLSALIDDLFELSRIEAGDIEWSMERVRLDELVAETVEALSAQAATSHVEVSCRFPDGLPPARANPEKLQRMLFNLIQNAIRHTPPDGSVTVMAREGGRTLELEVADEGSGLSPEDRRRAFEPFYRGGNGAARSGQGSGLGLTICRAIVEAHGGRIWFADSSGGARVRVSLPRATG
jgi:signal transduction histidine kinase